MVPLKEIEYGVYGDVILLDPKRYSIYFRRAINPKPQSNPGRRSSSQTGCNGGRDPEAVCQGLCRVGFRVEGLRVRVWGIQGIGLACVGFRWYGHYFHYRLSLPG